MQFRERHIDHAVEGRVKVTDPHPGQFCITLDPSISVASAVPIATADFTNDDTTPSMGHTTFIEPLSTTSFDCAATDLEFDTGYTYSATGVHTNEPFWFTVN